MRYTPMLKTVMTLRVSTTLAAAAAALLLSTAFYVLFVYGFFSGSYLHEIFTDRGTIPFITTFLFFWGVSLLGSAWLGVRREEATFEAIRRTIRGYSKIGQEHAPDVILKLERDRAEHGGPIASNRFLGVVTLIQKGVRRLSEPFEKLRDQADIDDSVLQAQHAFIQFFMWLIPVLGFIGTVLGISAAIVGFVGVFEQANEFVEVKQQLGAISQDLGLAFETTLLALIKTALLMFGFTMIRARERGFLIQVERFCDEDLMTRIELLEPRQEDKSEVLQLVEAVSAFADRISTWDPRFSEALDRFLEQLQQASESQITVLQSVVADAEQKAHSHHQALTDLYLADVDRRRSLSEEERDAAAAVAATIQSGVADLQTVAEAGGSAAASFTDSMTVLVGTFEQLQTLQTAFGHQLQALTALDDFNQCLQALQQSVEQLPGILRDLERPREIRLIETVREEV